MNAAAIDAELAGVWDTREADSPWFRQWPDTARWSSAHLSERRNRCYRAEFYLIDAPFVVLHCFAEDPGGRILGVDGEPAAADPVIELLDELPPPHLLGKG
jgi:hypothetical protein